MDQRIEDKSQLDEVLNSLSEDERKQILELSRDASYLEPRVLTHLIQE